jgi:MtrB/PioB family decaheme-associated outer membrane protein
VSAATIGTATIALGLAEQDDAFLPFTVNSGVTAAALPRNSLEGEIKLFSSNVNVTHKFNPATQMRAFYNQQEQENKTQRASYAWVVADYINSTDPARRSVPYSFRKRQLGIDGRHLVDTNNTLTGAVKQENFDRTYQDTDSTDQTTVQVKLKNTSHKNISFSLKTGREIREGGAWVPFNEIDPAENTLIRKYNLADRQRDNTQLKVAWTPSAKLTSGLAIDYAKDDYDRSEVGLQESSETGLTIDASYTFSQAVTLTASYSNTRIQSTQAGSQTASTPDWSADNDERIDTLLIGAQYAAIKNRLYLGIDYSYSDASGETSVSTDSGSFPDLESTRHTINIFGNYQLKKQLSVLTRLIYEKYDESDWQTDSVAPNTLSNTLTMGQLSPSYDTGVISISVRRDF